MLETFGLLQYVTYVTLWTDVLPHMLCGTFTEQDQSLGHKKSK